MSAYKREGRNSEDMTDNEFKEMINENEPQELDQDDGVRVITDENRCKWIVGASVTIATAVGFTLLMYFLDLGKMHTLQITNVVTYIVCMAANGASQKIMPHSLSKMSA